MSEPFYAEIRIFPFGFAPKGWAVCNGQLLPINQNQELFSLLGTTYGGDGRVTFALPNLQGRTPVHSGNGILLGEKGGEENHIVGINELPTHSHMVTAANANGDTPTPVGSLLAAETTAMYAAPDAFLVGLDPGSITSTGNSQPHNNMQPFLTLNFCIALSGIFPPFY